MKKLSKEEVNIISAEYVSLRAAAANGNRKSKEKFKRYQNYCMEKLKYLVQMKANKYRKFSNHPDLEQEGFEALLMALKTYRSDLGSFVWWANKYISTRMSRAANAHSTIKIPMKVAKKTKPHKVSLISESIDIFSDPFQEVVKIEDYEIIKKIVNELSDEYRDIINTTYGFDGNKFDSIESILKTLNISRPKYMKLLREAQEKIKKELIILVG